ncbi:MAG: alpha/beta hydrolase [Pikeienuella sp.]
MTKIDKTPFTAAAIPKEVASFTAELEATLAKLKPTYLVPVELTRKAREEGKSIFPIGGPLPGSDWHDIPGAPGGPGRVRVSSSACGATNAVFLHIHGGGWTLGAPHHYDKWCQYLAANAGCTVISIEYRLAPENPWPACADDCEAAARWALAEYPEATFAIGGESAGAHLAAVTLGRLKATGQLGRISGALLHYGVFDLSMTPSMANWGDRNLILSTPIVDWFCANLAAPDPTTPDVSPLYADLTDMPAALFQCGTADPLIDDTLFMAQRWAAAGGEAEVELYSGAVHAFDMFETTQAAEARAKAAAFLTGVFAP